ncbi:hypothetical protein [Pyrobaculum aerophilum]|uniref:Uncharacterized protein n=1 Tax=Pyrobaculum aerophilum TaxID=13773 RepID=A0A371QY24_9CREN|nr:hypothetical protein [Pyrobaculum aerophilum]RFA94279.1 hypothetical protein CGL52_14550 [Pyrobaculum aerophilum]RFA95578.1 hypothetical protein CGL51_07375 [Pyrobaculum aerophilum]
MSAKINWAVESVNGFAHGVCEDRDKIYIVGVGAAGPRMEIRRKNTGELERVWAGDGGYFFLTAPWRERGYTPSEGV